MSLRSGRSLLRYLTQLLITAYANICRIGNLRSKRSATSSRYAVKAIVLRRDGLLTSSSPTKATLVLLIKLSRNAIALLLKTIRLRH